MEQIQLSQSEESITKEKSVASKVKRFLIASTIPLALLAVGCSAKSSHEVDSVPTGNKIETKYGDTEREKIDQKILRDSLVRVAGGTAGIDVFDNGDLAVKADSNYYRLNDVAKEKVLSVARENLPDAKSDLFFKRLEESSQADEVKRAVKAFGQSLSLDQLTPRLKTMVKAVADLSRQLNNKGQASQGPNIPSESKTNPEAKDFLQDQNKNSTAKPEIKINPDVKDFL